MRLNSLGQVALNEEGRAVCPWLTDTTVGPYQRDLGGDVWQLVTRDYATGVVTPVPGFTGGCNESAAGGGQWMRYLAGGSVKPDTKPTEYHPPLAGNRAWTPTDGFVGDINDRRALTISKDGLVVYAFTDGAEIGAFKRKAPFGGVRLKGDAVTWFEFNQSPNITARRFSDFTPITVQALGTTQYTPIVFDAKQGQDDEDLWVLYQIDELGGVCHRIHDASQGYTFGTPQSIFDPDVVILEDGSCVIGWSNDAGQFQPKTRTIPVLGEGMVPLTMPVPSVKPLPCNIASTQLAGTWVSAPTAPGNAAIGSPTYTVPNQACVITEAGYVASTPKDRLAALLVYVSGTDDDLQSLIYLYRPVAAKYQVPLWIYDDRREGRFDLIAKCCGTTPWIYSPQWYLNIGEDPNAFAAEMLRISKAYVGKVQFQPTIRAYCACQDASGDPQYDAIPQDRVIEGLNALITAGCLKLPGYLGPMFFAYDRKDGIANRPKVAEAVNVWMQTPATAKNGRAFADQFYPPTPPTPIPPTPTPMDTLLPGQQMLADKPLLSQNTRFRFLYQRDGNLVLYGPQGAMWATGTNGQSVGFVTLQGDGNFVVYNGAGKAVWASGTNGKKVNRLLVQNDGNVVLYGPTGAVWATGTVYQPPVPTPIPPIPPIPPGTVKPDMHAWPFFGGSYATGPWRRDYSPNLLAALNRDAGGNFTRFWLHDAWGVTPNGPGQHRGIQPWVRDSAGVFDLSAPDPEWDDRLNQCVTVMNNAGIVVQLSVLNLYSWSTRKEGLLWVPDPNLGPFRRNKNGVYWGDDATFDFLPDWVAKQLLRRAAAAVRGLAVTFEVAGNEFPEKRVHVEMAALLRAEFTPEWNPDITCNRNEDTSGQYFNMAIGKPIAAGVKFDGIGYHGKDSLAYLDEVYEDEPSSRPKTFRELWDQAWPEGKAEPKRIIMSSDGCRSGNGIEDCYNWPVLAEVARDHIRRGFTFEHQSRAKMRPFLEGTLDLRADFEVEWLRSLKA